MTPDLLTRGCDWRTEKRCSATGQFATACAEFDRLRDKGLGSRDLGLPAARVRAEGGRGRGDRVAELDAGAVPAGVGGGGASLRGAEESPRFSGHLRASMISGPERPDVGVQ